MAWVLRLKSRRNACSLSSDFDCEDTDVRCDVICLAGALFVLGGSVGCKRHEGPATAAPVEAYGYVITTESAPSDVVGFFLEALRHGDRRAMESVLAQKRILQDVQDLTQGASGKAFDAIRNNAVAVAASALALDLSFLAEDSRAVGAEIIAGDSADVTVEGRSAQGQVLTRTLHLIREDLGWRIVPSRR